MDDQNYSFVVRVWLESTDRTQTKRSVWRGSIEQVGSDGRVYFSDFNEITQFIEEQIKIENATSSSTSQRVWKNLMPAVKKYWRYLFR